MRQMRKMLFELGHPSVCSLNEKRRLNWKEHVLTKRKHLEFQLEKRTGYSANKSQLSIGNKLLLFSNLFDTVQL